jgi:hypothetical protein
MKLSRKWFIFLTLIAVLICFEARADILPDTLRIKTMPDDTAKVNLMNTIADKFRDFDTEKGLF